MMKKKLSKLFVAMLVAGMCVFGGMSVTAFAYVDDAEVAAAETEVQQPETQAEPTPEPKPETPETVVEETKNPEDNAFSVPGNGEVLDDITDDSSKEFYTIRTANNNTFYMVVDRSQNSQNVYMLSMIDEDDLAEFMNEKETEQKLEDSVVIPEVKPTEVPETEIEKPEKPANSGMNSLAVVGIVVVAGLGGFFLVKMKSKKKEEEIESENLEVSDGLQTVNEDDESDE